MAVVIIGDMHYMSEKDNAIKHKQTKLFMNWLSNNHEVNQSTNTAIFLGDIAEYNIDYRTIQTLLDWLQKLKFQKIYIIQGNHDCIVGDTLLSVLETIPKVEIIKEPQIKTIEEQTYLCLPHYEGDMYKRYNNLHTEKQFEQEFDWGVGHIADENNAFGGSKFIDLSNLKVTKWLLGHIHSNSERYLGSVIKNSSTEKNDSKYIAVIDNKEYELIKVPNFLDYITCNWGEYPEVTAPLNLFQINNCSTSKAECELEYKSKYGVDIGFTRILSTRQTMLEQTTNNNSNACYSIDNLFNQFAQEKKLNQQIIDICKKVIL